MSHRKAEQFNNYVKQLWNAGHTEAITKILKEYSAIQSAEIAELKKITEEAFELLNDAKYKFAGNNDYDRAQIIKEFLIKHKAK